MPPVVKHHIIVALELFLFDSEPGSGPLRKHLERGFQQQLIAFEAADAFDQGTGFQLAPHRDTVSVPLDVEGAYDRTGPARRREPQLMGLRLNADAARPRGKPTQVNGKSR